MALSEDLISQFTKIISTESKPKTDNTAYGTIVSSNDIKYVQLDGSEIYTPITTTTNFKVGERVMVMIKNHTATVIGNVSSPSVTDTEIKETFGHEITDKEKEEISALLNSISAKIGKFENVTAILAKVETLQAKYADFKYVTATDITSVNATIKNLKADIANIETITTEELNAVNADIDNLTAHNANFTYVSADRLNALKGEIKNLRVEYIEGDEGIFKELEAEKGRIDHLEADVADIELLKASKAEVEELVADYATIELLDAEKARITNLEAIKISAVELDAAKAEITHLIADEILADRAEVDQLLATKADIESLDVMYANIDFANIGKAAIETLFSKSGMIEGLVVGDQTITGKLVGVTIDGDSINANTIKADKLVVKGEDGIYYKLNVNALGQAGVDELTNEEQEALQNGLHGSNIIAKSITADKLKVTDLVAFGATIGGFKISDNAIHSVVKETVDNTTLGLYMDNDGQFAIGDKDNFIKLYKDENDNVRLVIMASSIILGSNGKSVEDYVNEVKQEVVQEANDIEVGSVNLVRNSNNGMASSENYVGNIVLSQDLEVAETYTISMKATLNSQLQYLTLCSSDGSLVLTDITHVQDTVDLYRATFMVPDGFESLTVKNECTIYNNPPSTDMSAFIGWIQLERGIIATDYAPAPEDLQTGIDDAKTAATGASGELNNLKTELATNPVGSININEIIKGISLLVKDENTGNVFTQLDQTEQGWVFRLPTVQQMVTDTKELLDAMNIELGAKATVEELNNRFSVFEGLKPYIQAIVFEGEPCLELGKKTTDNGDARYTVRITNTRVMFYDNDAGAIPTYITTYGVTTDSIKINKELRQNQFVWKVRSNGNYGLQYLSKIET